MTRIVVVFPAPFGPRKPRTSPFRTSKLTSDTASVGPYRFVKPSTSIMSFYPYAGCWPYPGLRPDSLRVTRLLLGREHRPPPQSIRIIRNGQWLPRVKIRQAALNSSERSFIDLTSPPCQALSGSLRVRDRAGWWRLEGL